MSKKTVSKIKSVTPNQVKAKKEATLSNITTALQNEYTKIKSGDKAILDNYHIMGTIILDAIKELKPFKVNMADVYDMANIPSATARLSKKIATQWQKIIDNNCQSLVEARKIIYPKRASDIDSTLKKVSPEKIKEAEKKVDAQPKNQTRILAEALNAIGRLNATPDNFTAIMNALTEQFPKAMKTELKIVS